MRIPMWFEKRTKRFWNYLILHLGIHDIRCKQAETQRHCHVLEAQIRVLQKQANDFKLVPLICTWISVMDDHTCQRCSELNGKIMTGQEALAYQKEIYDLHTKGEDKCRCLIKWSGV